MLIMFTKQNQYTFFPHFGFSDFRNFPIFLHFRAILLTAKKLFIELKPKILFVTIYLIVIQKAITRWRKSPVWTCKKKACEKGLCSMPPVNPTDVVGQWNVFGRGFLQHFHYIQHYITLYVYVQSVISDPRVQMVRWVQWGSSLLPLSRHWCVRFGLVYRSGRI